jgi:hypothetical protein
MTPRKNIGNEMDVADSKEASGDDTPERERRMQLRSTPSRKAGQTFSGASSPSGSTRKKQESAEKESSSKKKAAK